MTEVLKTRILFLSELFYPQGGGAEYATYLIAKELVKKGHTVRVITNQFPAENEIEWMDGVEILRKNLISSKKSVKFSLLLKGDLTNKKWMKDNLDWAQVVYIPRYWFNIISSIKKTGKPVIVHLHDYIAVCPVANLYDSNSFSTCTRKNCSIPCI